MGKPARATIKINGQTYDALSGQPVADAAKPATAPKAKAAASTGHSMDGVVRAPAKHHRPTAKTVHAKPKRAATLNRAAVKKTKAPSHHSKAPSTSIEELKIQDEERLKRAKSVHKSHAISKFGPSTPAATQPSPTLEQPSPPPELAPPTAPISAKEELISQHLAKVATSSSTHAKPKAHHKVKQWLKSPRRTTILATSASALLLVGYITYINIPNMSLRVASSRAGFTAHLPGYQPAGFNFSGPVAYQPGEITVSYNATGGDRTYRITQKESNWDSQTLLEYIEPQAELYPATYQESGLTVYIYDSKIATWINAGVWYTIDNDSAQLTTEQMLKIAASL